MNDILDDPDALTQDDYLRLVEEIVAKKRTQAEVARALGLTRQAVSRWVATYKETGRIPVVGKTRVKKGELRPFEDIKVKKLIEDHNPSELELEGGGEEWTAALVERLVKRQYDRELSKDACVAILEGCRPKGSAPTLKSRWPVKASEDAPESTIEKASQADLDEMREKIREGQAKMAEAGVLFKGPKRAPHGVRTGKHARGSAKKSSKKKGRSRKKKR